jgi:hypothetical protein
MRESETPPPRDDLSLIAPDAPTVDSGAEKERAAFAQKEEKLFGHAARVEQLAKVKHGVIISFIVGVSFCAMSVLVIRILHYVLPSESLWLTEPQLQGLDKTFIGVIVGAIVSQAKRIFGSGG